MISCTACGHQHMRRSGRRRRLAARCEGCEVQYLNAGFIRQHTNDEKLVLRRWYQDSGRGSWSWGGHAQAPPD
jgi:hypothetical protein